MFNQSGADSFGEIAHRQVGVLTELVFTRLF